VLTDVIVFTLGEISGIPMSYHVMLTYPKIAFINVMACKVFRVVKFEDTDTRTSIPTGSLVLNSGNHSKTIAFAKSNASLNERKATTGDQSELKTCPTPEIAALSSFETTRFLRRHTNGEQSLDVA
jgi:hypothetical protein